MVQTKYKIKIYLIYFILLTLITSCAKKRIILKEEIIEAQKISTISAIPTSLFFISAQQTEGDIWLYDIKANSLWQISFLDNPDLKIISVSPENRYIVISDEIEQSYIIEIETHNIIPIKIYPDEKKLIAINNVCWLSSNSFLCTGLSNINESKIFKVSKTEDEWQSSTFKLPFFNDIVSDINLLSLSHNKKNLAILINNEMEIKKELYIYNFNSSTLKKLNFLSQSNVDIIWSEDNNEIFYNQDNIIYKIDLNGFNKILLITSQKILNIYQNPKYKFKLYYTIQNNENYVSLYLKNTDKIGPGEFIKEIEGLKNLYFLPDGEHIFYDTYRNEIHYLNLRTLEDNILFSDSALFFLTRNE